MTDASNDARVSRAADAVISLFSAYTSPAVTFIKTLDIILVALGDPFGLRVSALKDETLTFETLAGCQGSNGDPVQLGAHLRLHVLRPLRSNEGETARTTAITGARDFIAALSAQLGQAESQGAIPHFDQRLLEGLSAAAASDTFSADAVCGVSEQDAKAQLKEFFGRVETFLNQTSYRFQLPTVPDVPACPRFLFFHRFVDPDGNPVVRLHLLPSQRMRLSKVCEKLPGGGWHIDELEPKLAEALATDHWDLEKSFRSGVTAWMDWPWQRRNSSNSPAAIEIARVAISALAQGAAEVRNRGSIQDTLSPLIIPVHVDGLPWLALAAIFPTGDPHEKVWAQYFYRDLLPFLTTTIMVTAEPVFLEEVRQRALKALTEGKGSVEGITEALAPLASTFPYTKLTISGNGVDPAFRWQGSEAHVTPSQPDSGRVAYTRLDLKGVAAALNHAEADFNGLKMQQLEERMSSYVDIGHALKNLVSSTGWAVAAQEVAIVHRNFDVIERKGLDPKAIAQIRRALSFADRSLSLFWTVEGLGHFIRLAGAQSGKFEREKFIPWIDSSPLASAEPDSSILQIYALSIFTVGKAICFGWGWLQLTVSVDGEAPFIWSGPGAELFSIEDLHFPPFLKGSDGGFAIVLCITEPIVNAVRALGAFSPTSPVRQDPTSLRITVSRDSEDPFAVVVTIVNVSLQSAPAKLSGLESTKNMMRDMGIGRFDATSCVPLPSGLFEITNRVRFRPKAIVEAIKSKGK